MTEASININVNDLIIEQDDNGTAMGHVIDITPNWVTVHWLTGVKTHMPGGIWACPMVEAQRAIESGEWELLTEETRLNIETQ